MRADTGMGRGRRTALLGAFVGMLLAGPAAAAMVDVDVVSDARATVPLYRIAPKGHHETHRYYLEAVQGDRYAIRVTNTTGRRIGVVIAVDGRNVISGKKSNLRPEERMYILPPYGSGTYEGWRTDRDTVNRFYFTDPGDSYAGAFGDYSATGVIAVAVYREKHVPPPPPRTTDRNGRMREGESSPGELGRRDALRGGAPSSETAAPKAAAPQKRSETPGTGFGEETYSPSVRVAFDPEPRVAERHLLKYEWRDTLCRKGIIDCRWPKNRFWDDDDDGYAPYPPGRR